MQPDKYTAPVLDHGYVREIEHWGSDESIIESARMSTGKGFLGWNDTQSCIVCGYKVTHPCDDPDDGGCDNKQGHIWDKKVDGDRKLLAFLYNNRHMTPFEMAGMVFEIKMPIFGFREWHRHRTQSYNEMSARYIPLPNENYLPEVKDLIERSRVAAETANRQASSTGVVLNLNQALEDLHQLDKYYQEGQRLYDDLLAHGWPKELARLPVTVGRYSKMRVSANLRNWMQFLELRRAKGAQKEIQWYAQHVFGALSGRFPRTMVLYDRTHPHTS